jgi:uncharacterized integral membrane protein
MFRRILTIAILGPLALLILLAAIANRQTVTVSLDPFLSGDRAFAITQPLFVILLLTLIIGVVVGGVATWLRQGKWRRAARAASAELRAQRQENELLRQRLYASEGADHVRTTPSIGYRPPPAA